jgi:two-component system chemotaxis sensor kinase CheA
MMDFDLEAIRRSFLAESEEGLQASIDHLLALRGGAGDPGDPEAFFEVFRTVHTLKGNALSLDYAGLAELAHGLEDFLEPLREGEASPAREVLDLLLEALDTLQAMLGTAVPGEPQPPPADLLARLRSLEAPASAVDTAADARPANPMALPAAPALLRVGIEKLDRLLDLVSELTIARGRSADLIERLDGPATEVIAALREARWLEDRLHDEIQELVMRVRMVPLGPSFHQHQRTVRELARRSGKEVHLVLSGGDVEADASVIEQLRGPLTHLVRNAVDHGIEPPEERIAHGKPAQGIVALRAFQEAGSVVIEVEDDGRGIDPARVAEHARELGLVEAGRDVSAEDVHRLLFEPGFSLAREVTEVSGRGVGMDVVRREVEALRGTAVLTSRLGEGVTVRLQLPLTVAIIDGFAVGAGEDTWVLPLESVVECMERPAGLSERDGRGVINLRGDALPYVRLGNWLGLDSRLSPAERENVVVVHHGGRRAGLAVDTLYGARQTVIKPLGNLFKNATGVAGSAILGSGRVALVLDVPALLRSLSDEPRPAA